jgi:lactate dehydrogenase-like 2-hydroxyacid dehydrogenase
MTLKVLYPDAQFAGDASIEKKVFGDRAQLSVFHDDEIPPYDAPLWSGYDAIVCYHDANLDSSLIKRLDRCRVIVRAGVGFDQVDIATCASLGIPVCNTPDYGTTDVADHAIGLMLGLTRGIVAYHNALKADFVTGWAFATPPTIRRLSGRIFGVIGLGRIGTATALRAKGLGMQVVFFDPYRTTGTELALGFSRAKTLDELLAAADVISLHTPLSAETRNLIDRAAIKKMKPGAFVVNTSRGPVVELDAVLEGIRSGQLAGAGLDVFPVEPPTGREPLLKALQANDPALAGRLIITPHSAFYSPSSLEDLRRKSAETACDYLFAGRLRDCVNGLDLPGARRR